MLTRPVSYLVVAFFAAFAWLSVPAAAQGQILSINDVTQVEGTGGTTTFTFTVSLNVPTGVNVTFDIATANNTAFAGSDYVAKSLTGQTIPAGLTTYTFDVTVIADSNGEIANSFFVNVTNVAGATPADAQGLGTILNDDVIKIHDVQGNGASTPIPGEQVIVRGIVTGVTNTGFFVEEEDADWDADPATSEGIFVYTSSTPPVAAAFSAQVEVSGTVAEIANTTDTAKTTAIISPTVTQLAPAPQPLPTPVTLHTGFPYVNGLRDQLEMVESMRVTVTPSLTVTGPTQGKVTETTQTGSNLGIFFGVVTGRPRPFREAGIEAPNDPPSGSIPPIPRWDGNPEVLRVNSARLVGQPALLVNSGDIVGPITGPLDAMDGEYEITIDTTSTPVITPGTLATTVSPAAPNEFTVASINLRRFYDTTDDPGHIDPVVTAAAYDRRLAKMSIAIRTHLLNPDIIGVQEAENAVVLNDLAAKILTDGGPSYTALLTEGNDLYGLNVGVLIKTETLSDLRPRVSSPTFVLFGAGTTWLDPKTNTFQPLFDRAPMRLRATINRAGTPGFRVSVIVADLAGMTDIDLEDMDGLSTIGNRVRKKREAQAEFLASYINGLQAGGSDDHLVVVGGFNAFEVNDGFVDVLHMIAGTPVPDNQTVVDGDGVAKDFVNPDLVNLVDTPPAAERYSDVFEGTARNLDHALVTAGMIGATTARRIEHARIAADYPETHVADDTTALRFSDRDPVVAYFATNALTAADLHVTSAGPSAPVVPGENFTLTITVTNTGPDAAMSVLMQNPLVGLAFASLTAPAGWSCTTPSVGATGVVECTNATMSVGSAVFTVTASALPGPAGATANTTHVESATPDGALGNNASSITIMVRPPTDLSVTVVDTPDPVTAGSALTYTITVRNDSAFESFFASVTNPVGGHVTFASATVLTGDDWTITAPAVGATGDVVFSKERFGVGEVSVFQIVVTTDPATPDGTVQMDTATITSGAPDPAPGNNVAVATTTINKPAEPPTALTYYLAEGATGAFFDEDLLIANPNASEAPVTIKFFREVGGVVTETRTIPARSGLRLRVDELPGLEATSASVQVTSEDGLPLAVERTQFWGSSSYGGATETAVTAPATRWYFAEGAQGYFDTFVLVANPQSTPVDVTVTYLREGETPLTRTVQVGAFARKTIGAATLPDLVGRSFGMIVDATQPVVAERAMYFGTTDTRLWTGGGGAAGVTAPAATWYFAEGATGSFFDTFILLMNPDDSEAHVTMRYLLDSGETIDAPKVVPAHARLTVNIDGESDPRLHSGGMATTVTSDRPIVAERSVYWPTGEGSEPWGESHTSQGIPAAASRWALAEGRTGGELKFHTYVLLANPGSESADVTVQFIPESGTPVTKTYTIPAGSRLTLDVTAEAPGIQDKSFITLIETAGGRPIVVERSMYWNGEGVRWSGGSNAAATRLPEPD